MDSISAPVVVPKGISVMRSIAFFLGGDAGADPDFAAAQAVAVVGGVHDAAGGEIREQGERLVAQHGDGGFDEFVEIVRQHLAGEADGDALDALGEQQREFHRQRVRLLAAAVVAGQPVGGLRVEDDLVGELREAGLDVSRGGRAVAGEGVAPVSLGVDEQVLLAEADDGGTDRLVAVRVVVHRVSDDPGDLVVAAVVDFIHGVEDAALDRLEAVVEVGHRAFEDDVAGVIEEIIGIHRAERGMLVRVVRHVGGWLKNPEHRRKPRVTRTFPACRIPVLPLFPGVLLIHHET